MDYTKAFYLSKTFWGLLWTLFFTIAPQLGLNVTPDDTVMFNEFADLALQLIGIVFAFYGRLTAKTSLTPT